jgi:hypothetical protein
LTSGGRDPEHRAPRRQVELEGGTVHRRIALAAAAVLVLAGCSGAVVGSASSSLLPGASSPAASPVPSIAGGPPSVKGTATAGPVCPVEKSPPDPKCAPRPVAGAVIVAANAAGVEVGRATTAADGTYELIVGQTGAVTITAQPVAGLMGTPQPVTVTLDSPSQVEQVDLAYDTGIR